MSELRVVVTDYTFPNLAAEEAAARTVGAQFIPNHCGKNHPHNPIEPPRKK